MPEPHKINDLPRTFWAWLAGFTDGDGSIGEYARSDGRGQPLACIQLTQKGTGLLESIQRDLGTGSIVHLRDDYYSLRFGSAASRELCRKMLPYLRDPGKRERATRAIEWQRLGAGQRANSPEQSPVYDRVLQLYREGLSGAQIEDRLGLEPRSAQHWITRAGIARSTKRVAALRGRRMRGKAKTTRLSAEREQAVSLYTSGLSAREIGLQLKVSTGLIYYWLKTAGIPRRKRSGRPPNAQEKT